MKSNSHFVSTASIVGIAVRSSAWWDSLSPEQKRGYIEEHPESKYAKEGGGGDDGHKDTKPEPKQEHRDSKPAKDDATDDSQSKMAKAKQAIKKFLGSGEAKPGSEARKGFGSMLVSKAKGLLRHLAEEGHQLAAVGTSIHKLANGGTISEHEKHRVKEVVARLVVLTGATIVGGGMGALFAHGATAVAEHLATGFMAHGLVNVSEKTITHSRFMSARFVSASKGDGDAGMEQLAELLAKYLEESPDVQAIMEKYAS